MNRLVIIGNGFDLAHGLKTRYKDFVKWYWKQRILGLCFETSNESRDLLCSLKLIREDFSPWSVFAYEHSFFQSYDDDEFEAIKDRFEKESLQFAVRKSALFESISRRIETIGWVDIENEYYKLLVDNAGMSGVCKEINEELFFLQNKLIEYLGMIQQTEKLDAVHVAMKEDVCEEDISTQGNESIRNEINRTLGYKEKIEVKRKAYKLQHTMILNFNYTKTAEQYCISEENMVMNHIHGSLDNKESIIFGYGDELDRNYTEMVERNENELLKHSKSIRYLQTNHYRSLLNFIDGGLFQVCIMGHSCGNSDRTLLNTIFEHDNCSSIKPYYYINEKGEDNFMELTMNIYRHFTNKKLYRDRVVCKERCTTIDGKTIMRQSTC